MSLGKHIQLHFGVVRDKDREKHIKLNLPQNYRKDVLFKQLRYLPQLDNPAIANIVKSGTVDDMSLQTYLMVTSLLKNSIQEGLNMIVSDDGKLSDAAVKQQLDTKFLSVMCQIIPIDAIFKDRAKFDTQNPIISSLLIQIEISEKQKEKRIEKNWQVHLAEWLQQLSKFNRNRPVDNNNNNDDDDNYGMHPPPPPPFVHRFPSLPSLSDDDGDSDNNRRAIQKLLLGSAGERIAVRFGNHSATSELRMYTKQRIVGGCLNLGNCAFLEYLTSQYAKNIFVKNNMRIHVETKDINYNDQNMQESIYDFLQHNKMKKNLLDNRLDVPNDFNFYLHKIIAPAYYFKNFLNDHGHNYFRIRHTQILGDNHAMESLETKKERQRTQKNMVRFVGKQFHCL